LKADRFFKLSDYQGIRYLRNAFFFYGLAFFVRFILGRIPNPLSASPEFYLSSIRWFFEFFVVLAGFFLSYSLFWKWIESEKKHHSIFNLSIFVLGVLAAVIALLDLFSHSAYFLYFSQILIFSFLVLMSSLNYAKDRKNAFKKYHMLTTVIGLFAWILNFFLEYFFHWNKTLQLGLYLLNVLFFLIFWYNIVRLTRGES